MNFRRSERAAAEPDRPAGGEDPETADSPIAGGVGEANYGDD